MPTFTGCPLADLPPPNRSARPVCYLGRRRGVCCALEHTPAAPAIRPSGAVAAGAIRSEPVGTIREAVFQHPIEGPHGEASSSSVDLLVCFSGRAVSSRAATWHAAAGGPPQRRSSALANNLRAKSEP